MKDRRYTLIDVPVEKRLWPERDLIVRVMEYLRQNLRSLEPRLPAECEIDLFAGGTAHNVELRPLLGLYSPPGASEGLPSWQALNEVVSEWCARRSDEELRAIGRATEAPTWTELQAAGLVRMTAGEVSVRPFRHGDAEAVCAVWGRVFPDDPPWNAPEVMLANKLRVQPDLLLVSEVAGAVVGAVMAGYDGVRGWIYHLAVLPEHRRRGHATALVRAAEQCLRDLGCPKVNLQVRATNGEVVAFYRRLGYQVEERVSMGRRLDGTG